MIGQKVHQSCDEVKEFSNEAIHTKYLDTNLMNVESFVSKSTESFEENGYFVTIL